LWLILRWLKRASAPEPTVSLQGSRRLCRCTPSMHYKSPDVCTTFRGSCPPFLPKRRPLSTRQYVPMCQCFRGVEKPLRWLGPDLSAVAATLCTPKPASMSGSTRRTHVSPQSDDAASRCRESERSTACARAARRTEPAVLLLCNIGAARSV